MLPLTIPRKVRLLFPLPSARRPLCLQSTHYYLAFMLRDQPDLVAAFNVSTHVFANWTQEASPTSGPQHARRLSALTEYVWWCAFRQHSKPRLQQLLPAYRDTWEILQRHAE